MKFRKRRERKSDNEKNGKRWKGRLMLSERKRDEMMAGTAEAVDVSEWSSHLLLALFSDMNFSVYCR